MTFTLPTKRLNENEVIDITLKIPGGKDTYFAITATIYGRDKIPYEDTVIFEGKKYWCNAGGRCHDEILQVSPELKIFANLHLSDENGVPMQFLTNGSYHLKLGFRDCPANHPDFPTKFMSYYRVSKKVFDKSLKAMQLQPGKGTYKRFKQEAQQAIDLFDKLSE